MPTPPLSTPWVPMAPVGNGALPTPTDGYWLKGSGGAMIWAPITEADVVGLTADLAAKQNTSAKGVANGYAGLDGSARVAQSHTVDKLYSVGQLEGVSPVVRSGATVWENLAGVPNYLGAYSAATAYKDGDIVTYNGVLYICVTPNTNSAPEDWGVNQTVPTRLGTTGKTITDWNSAIENGWYMGNAVANAPSALTGWSWGEVSVHNPAWTVQRVWDFTQAANSQKYERRQTNGVWGAWVAIS